MVNRAASTTAAAAQVPSRSPPSPSTICTCMNRRMPTRRRGCPYLLVARDLNLGGVGTGMIFARVVPSKGVQSYAVKSLAADVASLGYKEFVFKRGNEPSILALKEAVKLERRAHRHGGVSCV